MYINIIYSVLYEKPSHFCFRMFRVFQKTKNIAHHHVLSVNNCSYQSNDLTKQGALCKTGQDIPKGKKMLTSFSTFSK